MSDDDDEVISYVGDNDSTDNLSEPDDEMETGSINDNFRNVFYSASSLINELATIQSITQYP